MPAATFVRADAAGLRFDPGSFDAVVCLFVLIHLPDDEQREVVQRTAGWLRPGGVLVATVGARPWTGEEVDWLGGGDRMW